MLSYRALTGYRRQSIVLVPGFGADKYVAEALAIIAGGGSERKQVEAGMASLAQLHKEMGKLRVHRLVQAGFSTEEAERISELHGSAVKSFM